MKDLSKQKEAEIIALIGAPSEKLERGGDTIKVHPLKIKVEEKFNVREDDGDIEELMQSIVSSGQKEPVRGFKIKGTDTYVLTDGHRRYKAIMLALEKGHPIKHVLLMNGSQNPEDRLIEMVITGTQKKPLTYLEEGEVYRRLSVADWSAKEIAQRVGKNEMTISNFLTLAKASKRVQKFVAEEKISPTLALKIIRDYKDDEDMQVQVIEQGIDAAQLSSTPTGNAGEVEKPVRVTAKNVASKNMPPMAKFKGAIETLKVSENPKVKEFVELLSEFYGLVNDKKISSDALVTFLSDKLS